MYFRSQSDVIYKAWKTELDGNEMKPEFVHDKSDTKNTFSVKYYRFAMLNV
jgi:hypothetical protein